jgi:hypothetical protein
MERVPGQENLAQKQERIKLIVSKFLEDKLSLAVQMRSGAMEKREIVDIVQCLQRVWPENDGVPWQRKPRFRIPNLDEELTIRFDLHSDYDITNKIMTLNISNLRDAKTPEELGAALTNVLEDVYHESEHIYNPGSDIEPVDVQETIEYLGNPGEIEAHARQFAYRYRKEFPGEPFDLAKMKDLAQRIKGTGRGDKHYNYFVSFADPIKQEKFKEFGDVKTIHEKIVEATLRHLLILASH